MSNLPPPYWSTAADLKAEGRDTASLIRKASQGVLSIDQTFYNFVALLGGKGGAEAAPANLQAKWKALRESYIDLIWSSRETAGQVEARNQDFVQNMLEFIFDDGTSKDEKVSELQNYLKADKPKLFTKAPDTLSKIDDAISEFDEQREDLTAKVTELKGALDSPENQIWRLLEDAWMHVTNDTTHIKNRLDGSTDDSLPDKSMVEDVYKELGKALQSYQTTVAPPPK